MTPFELDLLAAVQADIRDRYLVARHHVHLWEPADAPPRPDGPNCPGPRPGWRTAGTMS